MRAREKGRLELVIEEKLTYFQQEGTTKYLRSSIKECLMKNNKIYREQPQNKSPLICLEYEVVELTDGSRINWITYIDVIG